MNNIFKNKNFEEKKFFIKCLLAEHCLDLHKNRRPLSEAVLYSICHSFSFVPTKALNEMEKSDRVVVQFVIDESKEKKVDMNVNVFSIGEHTWGELYKGEFKPDNGLCLEFVFNGDYDNCLFYIIYEKQLRELAAQIRK